MEFRLRPWTNGDLESLVKYANNFKIARFMSDGFPHPYTPKDGKAFIQLATAGKGILYFAIDVNGEAAGGIGVAILTDIKRKNAELGYWLGEPFWGNGIVTKAVMEMVEIAFCEFDINRIFALPFGTNLASQRVLEKAGFKLEAKFEKTLFKNGEFLDEMVYAVRKIR